MAISCLHSWFWVGWQGRLDNALWLSSSDYLIEDSPKSFPALIQVSPLVHWHKLRDPCLLSIQNYHPKSRDLQDTDHLCFPPGWSWNKDDLGGFWTNSQTSNQRFRYSIPSSAESPVSDRKRHGPLLFYIAKRAWFFIGRQVENIPVSRAAMSVSMTNMNGQWSGISRLSRASSRSAPVGTKCEPIAISSGKTQNFTPGGGTGWYSDGMGWSPIEWNLDERPKESSIYAFYNVLWIG